MTAPASARRGGRRRFRKIVATKLSRCALRRAHAFRSRVPIACPEHDFVRKRASFGPFRNLSRRHPGGSAFTRRISCWSSTSTTMLPMKSGLIPSRLTAPTNRLLWFEPRPCPSLKKPSNWRLPRTRRSRSTRGLNHDAKRAKAVNYATIVFSVLSKRLRSDPVYDVLL